jgi:hypothetical protein
VEANGLQRDLQAPDQDLLQIGEGISVDEAGRAIMRFADLLAVEVLRDGQLLVQELDVTDQSAFVTVLQSGGTLINDFDPQEEIERRFTVQTDFAIITATGTRFVVVREVGTPLEWVLALDATEDDLKVQALEDPNPSEPTIKPVPSGVTRWIAPIGVPSAGISADMENVQTWIQNAQDGIPVAEFGEIVWPHADISVNTAGLAELPSAGEPLQLDEVTLMLDPQGIFGSPDYKLEDCNDDGLQDLAIQGGKLVMDFRTVLSRVRALDVTVFNRDQQGSGLLEVLDPAREPIASQPLEAGPGKGQVLSLRSDEPYHYAELTLSNGCFLGLSLTPPTKDGQPGAPRPAVEDWQGLATQPTAAPPPTPESDYAQITDITIKDGQYAVAFETLGFEPELPGQHVHFFFNTVPPEEAGLPGKGPWILYGGPSPFTQYGVADRPSGATQMCILVANPDHSVLAGSGNCYDLPESP